jgi:hypothetical protein
MVEPSINSSPIPPNVPSDEIQRNDLQKTADYYVFQKAVRTSWRSCIILGVIGVIFGFIFTRIFSPINLIMVPIGLLLVIAGIRSRVTTKLNSLLLSGISLVASGIWIIITANINFFAFFNYISLVPLIFIILNNIFLGVGVLVDAISPLIVYRRYSANIPLKPTDEKLKEMKFLTRQILKAATGNRPRGSNTSFVQNVIWFNLLYTKDSKKWYDEKYSNEYRAKLTKTSAIIVSSDSKRIYFLRPEEFAIIYSGERFFLKRHLIEVRIKGSYFGSFFTSNLCLQRYEQWKNTLLHLNQ